MGSDSPCPTTTPVLILLRGNSGSGKSTVAAALRQAYGRGLAIIGQDVVRREILRERDLPGAANITMIDLMARHALAHGFHVVVEGIMRLIHKPCSQQGSGRSAKESKGTIRAGFRVLLTQQRLLR